MTKEEIDIAAKHSLNNKHEIEKSKMCGCYYCERTFPASLIRHQDYTDGGRTALCPLCGIDAVIGDASGVPINKKVLTEIYHVMFESESLAANAGSLIDGFAKVWNDDVMWGFIDKNGQTVIPCKWKGARDFCEGLAPVMNDDRKWGFIDKNGENVIPCKWSDVEHFSEGLAVVVDENHKCGYINMEVN